MGNRRNLVGLYGSRNGSFFGFKRVGAVMSSAHIIRCYTYAISRVCCEVRGDSGQLSHIDTCRRSSGALVVGSSGGCLRSGH